ncbi:MAG: nickel pincer cofactor biosynthesis protein LarB [Calditrichaeota bacterium]|nr:MAG: nickel pincer cofactor biosynthesis protein LarB [Calditrichota bacterium]
MYREKIEELLLAVKNQQMTVDEALQQLQALPYEDLGFANLDHHRALRKGFPEVVFCQNKPVEQAVEIICRLAQRNDVLATRATRAVFERVQEMVTKAEFNEVAGTIVVPHPDRERTPVTDKKILVITAGTSDIPVAEEAVVTVKTIGHPVERLYDVGVAGIHRLFDNKRKIDAANVLVVVAGMDGALPAVVAGLVGKPVIAVPTSVGYGASFQGIGPLLTMLNACAPGVAVVNIDNGFGAGYFATLINK